MTPACACLRFMIHPVKAATSFDCDGCSHHASFHKMENRAEDEIVARWRAEEKTREEEERRGAGENVEERFDEVRMIAGGPRPTGVRKRRRLEGAGSAGGATLSEVMARGVDELVVTGTGVNARRSTAIKKGHGNGTGRRIVDLEAEHTG